MKRIHLALAGCFVLAVAWSDLPSTIAPGPFSAHMVTHIAVMTVAAPLIAMAAAGTAADPTARWPALAMPVLFMLVELVAVWGWHAPALHRAARYWPPAFLMEQASFFAVGAMLWISVFGGRRRDSRSNAGNGIVAMLLTSMHMTLLGALITLAPRALFAHPADSNAVVAQLMDQQIAGMVMLFGGAASYLAGGLFLLNRLLRETAERKVDDASLG